LAGSLRDYELVVILNPEISEDNVPASLERLQQSIAGRGGEVVDVSSTKRTSSITAAEREG
jgi:ribosomal protein S6